jgi:sulfate transport system ATP-binding protein
MSIEIDAIEKSFRGVNALDGIDLQLPGGQLTALLGPSGSGKTTLLRILAGLETPDRGRIRVAGRDVTHVPVRDRRVGFVFQHYALFRHMSVAENVAFGLSVRPRRPRPHPARIRHRVHELLDMVQLDHLADRYPAQLSGGQKQRIALARALAVEPDILLLDEPFGALDARVRKELRRWLRNLHDQLHFTSVFVTHDQEEALELSDRVVVMNHGHVEQVDGPQRLYERPLSRFVFDFLGRVNVLSGMLRGDALEQGEAFIRLPESCPEASAQLYMRPHELQLVDQPTADAHLPLRVEAINLIGAEVRIELRPDGWETEDLWEVGISHQAFNARRPERGERYFAIPGRAHLFGDATPTPRPLVWPRADQAAGAE